MSRYEQQFELPDTLSNEIVIEEDNKKIVYEGSIWGLWLHGVDMRCGIAIKKYKLVQTKSLRLKLWPPRVIWVKKEKRVLVWSLRTEYNHKFIIFGGELIDRSWNSSYWCAITQEGTKNGILLLGPLHDQLFGPIEKRVVEVYRAIYKPKPQHLHAVS